MKLAADRQGSGEEEFVDNTIREIEAAVARWDGTFGRELASTLAAFLREPGELVVLAEPATPRTVGEIVTGAMFSPEQPAEDIGLTVDRRGPSGGPAPLRGKTGRASGRERGG